MPKKVEKIIDIYWARFDPGELNPEGKVLEHYKVGEADVYIVDKDGYGYYMVNEPNLDEEDLRALAEISDEMIRMISIRVEDPKKFVEESLLKIGEMRGLRNVIERSMDKLSYYIIRDMFGYERLDVLFNDEDVEEISCTGYNSPVTVIHRRYGEYDWMKTNIGFRGQDDIDRYVRRLSQKSGKNVTTAHPFIDAISPTGDRVSVTFMSEITLPGSTIAIRKFPKQPLTITHLLNYNSLTPLMAAYLWILVESKGYIMIVGAMGTGKTTLLSCLTNLINPNWKVCTIEDTPEVKTFHEQWLRMKSRVPLYKAEVRPITLVDLVIISLRHRPDYIIVGETRSVEIQALTQAAALGHGCMTTFHGSDARNALTRMAAPPLNVGISGQLLIWAILTTRRLHYRGKAIRRVVSIEEVDPYFFEHPKLIKIFSWNPTDDTFEPDDPAEVVKRSVRLKTVMDMTGWTEDDLVNELRSRCEFLQSLVDRKVFDYKDVVSEIRGWYGRRLGVR